MTRALNAFRSKRGPQLIGKYFFVLDASPSDYQTTAPADSSDERYAARGQAMEFGYLRWYVSNDPDGMGDMEDMIKLEEMLPFSKLQPSGAAGNIIEVTFPRGTERNPRRKGDFVLRVPNPNETTTQEESYSLALNEINAKHLALNLTARKVCFCPKVVSAKSCLRLDKTRTRRPATGWRTSGPYACRRGSRWMAS